MAARNNWILWIFILTSATYSLNEQNTNRPNILFLLLDDLGYGDLSFMGGQFPTPNMDQLYENSLRINRHYIHLLCSPSRTQFLTGRYAMHLGFGDFVPWDDKEIGGIPIGQPTIAQWLSEYGDYTTYAIAKWHLGYANKQLTPLQKGFDHFYGFYQGAIDYITKEYQDIERGNSEIYDFWEDGVEDYEVISANKNTMHLYADKTKEYLQTEADRKENTPFFLYLALQSMHTPYPDIPEHQKACEQHIEDTVLIVPGEINAEHYKKSRTEYCTLLLLTDNIIGDVIDTLHSLDLYENTLIVFTTDNGGDVPEGGSNFPLRGTKGEMFEGNERVITGLSGGYIEKLGLNGQERNFLMSNLDWCPTILDLTGYLKDIEPEDVSWDGISQYDMIVHGVKQRDRIILNIGDDQARSASILVEYQNSLYKYIVSQAKITPADRWIWSKTKADVWSTENGYRLASYGSNVSHIVDGQYLFDLTNDESETYNLMSKEHPYYSSELNENVISYCMDIVQDFLEQSELFSSPIDFLHHRFEEGEATKIGDGKFVRPFLSDSEYKEFVERIFEKEKELEGIFHSDQQIELYLNPWVCPSSNRQELFVSIHYATVNGNMMHMIWIVVIIAVVFYFIYLFYSKRKYNGYMIIKDGND